MNVRNEMAYLRRREAEEQALVKTAGGDAAREAHNLADAYAQRILEFSKAAK